MKFNPNSYENKGSSGGDLIPVGKHIVTVIEHEVGTTSGGHTQVVVTYQDAQGRTRKDWLICEGNAAFQFASLCHAVKCQDEIDLDKDRSIKAALYNRELEIVVVDETYQGQPKTKVKYRNAIKASSSPPSGRTPNGHASGRDNPPPVSDDDIPF